MITNYFNINTSLFILQLINIQSTLLINLKKIMKIMKNNYLMRMVFTLLLCGCFSMSYGADWYISATGDDTTGDGLTAGTAWASFSKAQTAAAASGDVIYVSGMINFSLEPGITLPNGVAIAKDLTIQGTSNSTDGFDGQGLTKFFSSTASNLTLKNIKLINGYSGAVLNGGAILFNSGTKSLTCENVIFESNKTNVTLATARTGGAVQIDNANGATFTNCLFLNNEASKSGAVFINAWVASTTINIVGCTFIGNKAKESFGGSALYIRSNTSVSTTLNLTNCTIKGNQVETVTNGGAVYMVKSPNTTKVYITNCTITENTTAGAVANSAGVFFLTSDTAADGSLYIRNSIIEGNTAATGVASDLNLNVVSATASGGTTGYIYVEKSIVGRIGTPTNIVNGTNYPLDDSLINHLPVVWTAADYKAKLGTFNTTTNSYPLLSTSPAIDYGLLSLLSPVTTDQLGASRSNGLVCSAGAIEFSAAAGEKIWKGVTSTDPSVTTNWFSGAVPVSTDNITIPKGKAFYPTYATDVTLNGGLIESGASLTVTEGKILNNTGTLTNNGSLTLQSSVTGTASLISATSVANVTQERYLNSNQRGWRMLSNPLSSTTFAALATSSNLTLGTNFTGEYLPASNTWTSTDGTANMDSQKAYKVFVTGQAGEAPDYVTGPTNVTIKVTGTATNTAPAEITTTATQFYLVANPYTAPVSVASIIAASTGLSNSVSYYNPTKSATDVKVKAGGYDAISISGAAGSATDIVLPPMGSIFVQATSDGTINIPTSVIFTGTPAQSGSYNHKTAQAKVATNALKVEVSSEGVNYDTVALQFKNVGEASSNIDFGKLPNSFLDAYTIADSQKRAISELELKDQIIPLGITSTIQKSYTIKVVENTIPAGYEAVLVDNVLNTNTVLTLGTSYDFAIDSTPASQGNARFAINLKTAGTLSVGQSALDTGIQVYPNPSHGQFNISNTTEGTSTIEISNLNGQVIHSQKLNSGTTTIQTKSWATGVYILKSSNNGTDSTKKLIIQ